MKTGITRTAKITCINSNRTFKGRYSRGFIQVAEALLGGTEWLDMEDIFTIQGKEGGVYRLQMLVEARSFGWNKEVMTSEKYGEYLKAMCKFHAYSIGNVILILSQMPEATRVAGYNAWKSKFKWQVKKGEKGIKIFAPCPFKRTGIDKNGNEIEHIIPYYKVAYVFDISQTEGEPLPSLGVDNLEGTVENYSALLGAIIDAAPVPVKFDNISGSANGYYALKKLEIIVQGGMSEIQTIKTAVHEVTHSILHLELKELQNSMETIRATAFEIIDAINACLYAFEQAACSKP